MKKIKKTCWLKKNCDTNERPYEPSNKYYELKQQKWNEQKYLKIQIGIQMIK